jgi:FkbM family methyltransferase
LSDATHAVVNRPPIDERRWGPESGMLERDLVVIREWRRSLLDINVLRGALSARAVAARHRASLVEARERERRFRAVSASYDAAITDAGELNRDVRVVQVDGLTWWVPLPASSDATTVDRYLAQQNFPYRAITQTRELGVGGIMLDIGCNSGRMAVPRVVLGDVEAVYGAEPHPLNYACLVRNVRDNGLQGLVMPDRVAIGSRDGPVRLLDARRPGGHRLVSAETTPKRQQSIEVPGLTIDSWCAGLGLDARELSFVKIDVQGSEIEVLRGGAGLLQWPHIAWQIEVDLWCLAQYGFGSRDLFDALERHFTHFVDLNRRVPGSRVRPIGELSAGLEYLTGDQGPRTDIVTFSLATAGTVLAATSAS